MLFCNFYVIYKLREVFTAIKMSIITEASKLMFEDRFAIRKGQNLKMQLKHAVYRSSNRNRLWLEIVLPY